MLKNRNYKILFLIICLIVSSLALTNSDTSSASSVLYVNSASGNNNYDGSSPTFLGGLKGPKKTIKSAITELESGGTIYVAKGTYKEYLNLTKNVRLIGANQKNTILDGKGTIRPLTTNYNSVVTISQFTIQNGKAKDGGAIKNDGMLTIKNCDIKKNSASRGGGGILSTGKLTLINTSIQYNSAKEYGGGICICYGNASIKGCTIQKNKVKNYQGGGIENGLGTVTISNSMIQYNTVKNTGGGINNFGKMIISNSKILFNKASYTGGGIENDGTLTIKNSKIQKNMATYVGGGINSSGKLTLRKSSVKSNKSRHGKNIHRS